MKPEPGAAWAGGPPGGETLGPEDDPERDAPLWGEVSCYACNSPDEPGEFILVRTTQGLLCLPCLKDAMAIVPGRRTIKGGGAG
jgi:hypothetical protein